MCVALQHILTRSASFPMFTLHNRHAPGPPPPGEPANRVPSGSKRVEENQDQWAEYKLEFRISFSPHLSVHGPERWLAFLHHRSNGFRDVLSAKLNLGVLSQVYEKTLQPFVTSPRSRPPCIQDYPQRYGVISPLWRETSRISHVLSLACNSSLFVPVTATGLFSAMLLASSNAAFKTSCLPPSTTLETSPSSFASAAENGRAE